MESDELGNDLVRIDGGFLVDEETYVVNSDDVLGKLLPTIPTHFLSGVLKRVLQHCVVPCITKTNSPFRKSLICQIMYTFTSWQRLRSVHPGYKSAKVT